MRRFCIALLNLSALPANAGERPALGNIPLTALALADMYPEAESVRLWLRPGWHPDAPHKARAAGGVATSVAH